MLGGSIPTVKVWTTDMEDEKASASILFSLGVVCMLPYFWFITDDLKFVWVGAGALPRKAEYLQKAISNTIKDFKDLGEATRVAEKVLQGENWYKEAVKSWETLIE